MMDGLAAIGPNLGGFGVLPDSHPLNARPYLKTTYQRRRTQGSKNMDQRTPLGGKGQPPSLGMTVPEDRGWR